MYSKHLLCCFIIKRMQQKYSHTKKKKKKKKKEVGLLKMEGTQKPSGLEDRRANEL